MTINPIYIETSDGGEIKVAKTGFFNRIHIEGEGEGEIQLETVHDARRLAYALLTLAETMEEQVNGNQR